MKLSSIFEARYGNNNLYIVQIEGTGEDYSWDLVSARNKQEARAIAVEIARDIDHETEYGFDVHEYIIHTIDEYVNRHADEMTRKIRQGQVNRLMKQSVPPGESVNIDRSTAADDYE